MDREISLKMGATSPLSMLAIERVRRADGENLFMQDAEGFSNRVANSENGGSIFH